MFAYQLEPQLAVDEFIDLLIRSTLAERRPIHDQATLAGMLSHASIILTARFENRLVGVSRAITDFHYCTYLSDLAVDQSFQRQGIGKELIRLTRSKLGARCTLILLSAPAAVEYYPHVRFEHHPQAWVLRPDSPFP